MGLGSHRKLQSTNVLATRATNNQYAIIFFHVALHDWASKLSKTL